VADRRGDAARSVTCRAGVGTASAAADMAGV
jgi:hypothetical protein